MKNYLLIIIFAPAILFSSCSKDLCEVTEVVIEYVPKYISMDSLRNSLKTTGPRDLKTPGKIYYKYPYLFVNEPNEGIHVINNEFPSSPQNISFIAIPGNIDLAIKGNSLYADSYCDLVTLDISNKLEVKELSRVKSIFTGNSFNLTDTTKGLWVGYEQKEVVRTRTVDCNTNVSSNNNYYFNFPKNNITTFNTQTSGNSGSIPSGGIGGSMARFAVSGNFLYGVTPQELILFNINNSTLPVPESRINVGWNIETIFPYKQKLFIGSQNGMFIYDITNPKYPSFLSQFNHIRSCDPVVANDSFAFVSLKSGTACRQGSNQLDVLNITDIKNPVLIKSYPMMNPSGLGINQDSLLFLCEGDFGLKVLNIKYPGDIQQLEHFTGYSSYDVIPINNLWMVIGKDGLYQYDASNPLSLKLVSKIPIVKN